MKIGTMKNKLTKTKFNSTLGIACHLFSRAACLGAVILICSSASAQNLLVSGRDSRGGEIFKFTWDGGQSIFASGLTEPWDLAFDNAGNLFVVDYDRGGLRGDAAIYKITQNGVRTTFASGLSYPAYLAVDKNGNVFVADYDHGMIYEYKPNGSRGTFTVLDPSDRPADLAFDSMGNLLMADLGGNIYRYDPNGVLRRHGRTTFGSVPNSAQSLACDSAGNLLVVDAGGVSSAGNGPNAIYKFTQQGARSTFASGQGLKEEFSCLAFQPTLPVCCQ
jgi:sugar lactone lactonase YvrE